MHFPLDTLFSHNKSKLVLQAFSITAVLSLPLVILAYTDLAPPRETGAPGDSDCSACHRGLANSGTGSVTVTLPGGLSYTPGVKQRLRVTVSETAKLRWGFQLSARPSSNSTNGQAGTFTSIDSFTGVICEDGNPRPAAGCPAATPLEFITHTAAGSRPGTTGTAAFDFDWTPPAASVGNIVLYVAGLAADNSNGSTGDNTYKTSYTLMPVVAAPDTITASPGSLTFSATGATTPPAQTFRVTSSGASLSFTTAVSTASGGNWLAAAPSGGSTPLDVSVTVNPAGLAPGSYSGKVAVSAAGAANTPQNVTVTLNVTQATMPSISASPATLSFTVAGGVPAAAKSILISASSGALSLTAAATTNTGGAWLSVNPMSGTTPATLSVTVDAAGLAAGSYTGQVAVNATGASNAPLTIPVTLSVQNAMLSVTPLSLSFQTPVGGSAAPMSVQVNSTGGALAFTASALTGSGGNWLSVSPASGTTPSTLSVAVDATALAAGSYAGSVTVVSAGAANSPRVIAVTLLVGAPPTTGGEVDFRFSALDTQQDEQHEMLLSGSGSVKEDQIEASGRFTEYQPGGKRAFTVVKTGTWTAKRLLSFQVTATNKRGKVTGFTLEFEAELSPTGGDPMAGVMKLVSSGHEQGVTLTLADGTVFMPTTVNTVAAGPEGGEESDQDQ